MAYAYDPNSNVATQTDGDANVTAYTYDGDLRELSEVMTDQDGNTISSVNYTYDLAGNQLTTPDVRMTAHYAARERAKMLTWVKEATTRRAKNVLTTARPATASGSREAMALPKMSTSRTRVGMKL